MTRRTLGIAGLWLGSLAAAVLVARSGSPTPAPATATSTTTERVIERAGVDRIVATSTGGLTEAELRAAIRAELAAADPAKPEVREEEVAPRDAAAFARADQTVTAAMADGRWSEEDRAALHGALADLAPDQIESLLSAVAVAINEGELETDGPPL